MCELTIQERALNHNIRLVRREAGNAKLIGVVKGNGYGLGLAELAGRLVDGGVRTLAVVNVVGSSIAREADSVMYTWAGPEIAVATTKAYSTQLAALYLVAVHMAEVRGQITKERR